MSSLAAAVAVAGAVFTAPGAHSQTGQWVWVGGSNVANSQAGVYGAKGIPAPGNHPPNRSSVSSATDRDGNFWLFGGTGYSSGSQTNAGQPNDLWKFNPDINEWTWWSGGDVAAPGVYGTLGVAASANTPGSRLDATLWTGPDGNIWLFGGSGIDSNNERAYLNDLWEFDVTTGEWTWMAGGSVSPGAPTFCVPGVYGAQGVASPSNVPEGRLGAIGWTGVDGSLWLFGGLTACQRQGSGGASLLNDLWKFDLVTGEWTWISGADTAGTAGTYGDLGLPSGGVPGARQDATNMGTDASGNFWLFGGNGLDSAGDTNYLNDLWEYTPATNQWIWQSGGTTVPDPDGNETSLPGTYGTLSQYAAGNVPGGREGGAGSIDSKGRLRLFGGISQDPRSVSTFFNDVWFFNPASKKWAWVGGSDAPSCVLATAFGCGDYGGVPSYGVLGVPAARNVPGGRAYEAIWTDRNQNLWLFGGDGVDSTVAFGVLNDMWKFVPPVPTTPVFGTMVFSPSATVPVGTHEAITISDTVTFAGVQPTGAVTYVLNGVSYTAPCTPSSGGLGSPETCSAQVPASTVASLPLGGYAVTGSLAPDDNYNAATAQSGTFTVSATPTGCTVPPPASSNTMNVSYYTLAGNDADGGTFPNGVSSNYVLAALGTSGLPVYNPAAGASSGAIAPPRDLLPDGEITWWSPALNNGGPGGTSDVIGTGTGVVSLPFSNNSFFPPNGAGPDDAHGFQTAVLTGNLVAPAPETVSFTIASDDMAFLYLDGQIVCDDGGVHSPASVPCTTSTLAVGAHTLQLFFADLNQSGAALDFTITTSNVGVGAGNQLVFGNMAFSPAATESVGTSQAITIADTLTYSGAQPTGSVSFTLNGISYAATCITAGSPASQEACSASVPAATIAALPVGVYAVTGSFKGDCSYADSIAPAGTFTITPKVATLGPLTFSPVATVLQGTSQAITIGDTLSFTSAQPTGAVAYVLNGVSYTATCTAGGSPGTCSVTVPAMTIAALPAASYTVTGSFAGDSVYAPATAPNASFTVVLPPPDFAIATGGPLALVTQHHGSTTISLSPINGFSGIVSLSCGVVPAYVTCEWRPAAVTVSGGTATTELTIDTSGILNYLSSTRPSTPNQDPRHAAVQFGLAGLVFPALLLLRRRRKAATHLTLCALSLLLAASLSGCGGRHPDSTVPGTYSITIQGTSGTIQHSAVLTLVVSQ